MPNYALADSVRCARHALAIDDERDAFHPLLWDELHEESAIERAKTDKRLHWIDDNRLEQVWFTGMHADVGGGYPDESLSYVSFLWMLEEAENAGLRAVPLIVARFRALASSAGPIHNSRAGVGSYYRYQPRRIGVWMEPLRRSLLARRHPDLKSGLIRVAKIHESVAARIASGTDRYAPITLPGRIKVVPPQRQGENAPQQAGGEKGGGSGGCMLQPPQGPPVPLIPDELRLRFEDPVRNAYRTRGMEAIWAQVSWRRRLYFGSLILTILLFLMPLWVEGLSTAPVLASGHGLWGQTIGLIGVFLPKFLAGIVESWANHPLLVLILLGLLFFTNRVATGIEQKLRDDTRRVWVASLGLTTCPHHTETDAPTAVSQTWEEDLTAPTAWPRISRTFRWRIVPGFLLLLMAAILFCLVATVAARSFVAGMERGEGACHATPPADVLDRIATFRFDTRRTCNPARMRVEKGARYRIEMNVDDWMDGDHAADPRGLSASQLGPAGYAGAPLRRAAGANYLQPVARISSDLAGPVLQPLELQQRSTPLSNWRGEFVARGTGDLALFANDAVLPFSNRFYANNRGTATVTVERLGEP
jgi:hypothetical protein